jgi:hypothetical protein
MGNCPAVNSTGREARIHCCSRNARRDGCQSSGRDRRQQLSLHHPHFSDDEDWGALPFPAMIEYLTICRGQGQRPRTHDDDRPPKIDAPQAHESAIAQRTASMTPLSPRRGAPPASSMFRRGRTLGPSGPARVHHPAISDAPLRPSSPAADRRVRAAHMRHRGGCAGLTATANNGSVTGPVTMWAQSWRPKVGDRSDKAAEREVALTSASTPC